MNMVIGGYAQGKLLLVLSRSGFSIDDVCDGAHCALDSLPCKPVFNRLHLLVRRLMKAGLDPYAFVDGMLAENPDMTVITEEIGYGIVPADPFERAWRETTGRVCCTLAQKSERVERVYAGIPTVIKGV